MKKSQEQIIREKLEKTGSVSRNWCLKMYISRLGSYICDMRANGMQIEGGYVNKNGGRDFVYKIIKEVWK